jgi:predicted neutral ceramidase superfamily lipid hydrolase
MFGFLNQRKSDGWNTIFLVTTALTSITGFAFPFEHLLPSHKVGFLSLVVLALAIPARYSFHLAGPWRKTYVVAAATALYLNVFVAVVQAFLKVPALKALAPTQKEPPFLVAQLAVLLIFVGLTILASKKFQSEPVGAV